MPTVVTISAPYGTGGSVIGPRLAERLGLPFLDRAIPVAVSRRLDIPLDDALTLEELPRDTLSRWMASFAPALQLFGGAAVAHPVPQDDEAFCAATEAVLRDRASEGAVILGRAGAMVLRDVPGALHVRLDATRERRLEQAIRMGGLDREQAEHELHASDLAREAYVRTWYRTDPADPSHYHLVIDSTAIDFERCVELIAVAAAGRS